MSKKLQEKQRRRLEAEQKKLARRRASQKSNMVTIGVAVVIAALVAVAVINEKGKQSAEANVGVPAAQAGCTEIEEFQTKGNRNHVDTGTEVEYETTPPAFGPHWPPDQVAQAGFYETPVEEERLVHNMEHGQLVFWYDPVAPDEVIANLRKVTAQEKLATITVPYEEVGDEYAFVMTAWGALQRCEQVSQEVIDDFRTKFQGRGPENVGVPTFGG